MPAHLLKKKEKESDSELRAKLYKLLFSMKTHEFLYKEKKVLL